MSIKELYAEGRQFRVIKEGARFEGLLLFGETSMSGWSRTINPGEILTCLGWQEIDVFGTHIAGVMWTGNKVPDNAMVMQIWPFESLFRPFPMTGVLEPYTEPLEDEELQALPPEPDEATQAELLAGEEAEQEAFEDLSAYFGTPAPEPIEEEEDEVVDLRGF